MRIIPPLLTKIGEYSIKYSNLPERYVRRAMQQIYHKAPNMPQYRRRIVQRRHWYFSTHRPWEHGFRYENAPGTMKPMPAIEPVLKWSFFRGDRVEILVGKDKGKQGTISQIIQERNWVIVEGLNAKPDRLGQTKDFPGIIYLKEQPLLVTTEVRLLDPGDLQGTEIEWRYTDTGDQVRVSVRSGKIIPIPPSSEETVDYKHPNTYTESAKDTSAADVQEITFKPDLKTFEMDIMEKLGIQEDRIPGETFWY